MIHFLSMPRRLLFIVMILLAIICWSGYTLFAQSGPSPVLIPEVSTPLIESTTSTLSVATSTVATNAMVVRSVDGDTIVVKIDGESTEQKIRMLGVDTPESVDPRKIVQCFGKEASKHTKETLEGKRVRLEEDAQADNVDKYGRLLRNVITDSGVDWNLAMVTDGFARAYLSFPLNPKRKIQIKTAEQEAKNAGRGLWSLSTCSGKL